MKTKVIRFSFVVLLIVFSGSVQGQSPVTIVFRGTLADVEKLAISNETCEIKAEILNSRENLLYQTEGQFVTDDSGKFIFPLRDLPPILSSTSSLVDISFQITSEAAWLPGGKFLVKYHLQQISNEELQLTRFEGQKLESLKAGPLYVYSDKYPLAYLKGVFLLSFTEDLQEPERMVQLYLEMTGPKVEGAPAPPADRGIKGGYAVGGYKTKK